MAKTMDHRSMILVLGYLAESGSVKSGEVAEGLRLKPKHASMVLLRCSRRGFVSKRPYKCGRVHGYIYEFTDKGAKWLLYKASQKKKADLDENKFSIEVASKSIQSPSLDFSKVNQNHQSKKDLTLLEEIIPLSTMILAVDNAPKFQSTQQTSGILAVLILEKISRERDEATYLYLKERARNRELLERNHHNNTGLPVKPLHYDKNVKNYEMNTVWSAGFEVGIKLGIEIGASNQLVQTQNTRNKILLKRMLGAS